MEILCRLPLAHRQLQAKYRSTRIWRWVWVWPIFTIIFLPGLKANAAVQGQLASQSWTKLELHQGQPIQSIAIRGLDSSKLANRTLSLAKAPIRVERIAIEKSVKELNDSLRAAGLSFAHVRAVEYLKESRQLHFLIWPRPIVKIEYRGDAANVALAEYLGIKQGGLFNAFFIERQSAYLRRSVEFSHVHSVSITPFLLRDKDGMVVVIDAYGQTNRQISFATAADAALGPQAQVEYRQTIFGNRHWLFTRAPANLDGLRVTRAKPLFGLTDFAPQREGHLGYTVFGGVDYQASFSQNLPQAIYNPSSGQVEAHTVGVAGGQVHWLIPQGTLGAIAQAPALPQSHWVASLGGYSVGFDSRPRFSTVIADVTLDDELRRIRAFQASRLVWAVGFDLLPQELYTSLWASYFIEVTTQSHLRVRLAGQSSRSSAYYPLYGKVHGQKDDSFVSLDAGQISTTGFWYGGLTYYLEIMPFFFAGPDVGLRNLEATNGLYKVELNHTGFAETGVRAFYHWDDYRFRLGVGRIFSLGTSFGSWALQFSIAYSF